MNTVKRLLENKFIKVFLISVIILIALEFTIFNFGTYALLFGNYSHQTKDIKSADVIQGFDISDESKFLVLSDSRGYIEFNNINERIKTVYFDISTTAEECTVDICFNEATNKNLRYSSSRGYNNYKINYIKGNENSKYVMCSFAGEVETLGFNVYSNDGEDVVLKGISINKAIPFSFSLTRFVILLSLITLINALVNISALKSPISAGSLYKNCTSFIIAILFIIALSLSSLASNGIVNDFKNPILNQINSELVDAFEAGQVQLLDSVPSDLLNLDNPYDWSERREEGTSYKWDHLLYEGEYYSYYGIAPVLLLFLPYHLITGMYFPSVWAIFIFGAIGIIFLGMTYYVFTKKLFPNISIRTAVIGLIITELISGIWYCLPIDNFYEIAQSSGFAFVTIGAYCLLTSNAVTSGKISNFKAALSSVFLSLAVLCRPTLAIYCIVALVFIFYGIKKSISVSKLNLYKYLASAIIPFIVIGSIQMVYNYLRFNSPFDFGIQYSLTINDFTRTEHHVPLALIGFYNFIFAFPKVHPTFPFVSSNYNTLGVNGYYFTANDHAIGILWRALPTFAYLLSLKAFKASEKNVKSAILIGASCILAPTIIIYSIWESGYGVRYSCDFAWQILIGAFAIAFAMYQKSSVQIKKIADSLLIISLIICISTNFSTVYEFVYNNSSTLIKAELLSFGRLFEFWNLM